MNPRIFFFAIVSALAGFLFGFDTVVISGAEQTIRKLWGLSPGIHGNFFCGMMILQLIWVKTMVPETKGVPLEDMQKQLGIH